MMLKDVKVLSAYMISVLGPALKANSSKLLKVAALAASSYFRIP